MNKVIVAITTYNLEHYISKALDSVLCQKTSFPFKIIVADDCSTDGTVNILKQYREKYPDTIELLLSEKNLGSLNNSNRVLDKIDCEYFAFLDGDDYWLSESKLQYQVDFLDTHPSFTMIGGNTVYLKNGNTNQRVINNTYLNQGYNFNDLLNNKVPFVHTSSLLFRNVIFSKGLPNCYFEADKTFENCALRGEDFRRILHLQRGDMFISDQDLSVYRIHDKGIWQGSSQRKRYIEGAIGANFYRKYFSNLKTEHFQLEAINQYKNLMQYLTIHEDIEDQYTLNENETQLLMCYLEDISANPLKFKESSKFKQLLCKAFNKIIRKIP